MMVVIVNIIFKIFMFYLSIAWLLCLETLQSMEPVMVKSQPSIRHL